MNKPMFKVDDMFFHSEQNLFVQIDQVNNIPKKGWLYNLKVFDHVHKQPKPWKRYYEAKVLEVLQPVIPSHATKVLYGEK